MGLTNLSIQNQRTVPTVPLSTLISAAMAATPSGAEMLQQIVNLTDQLNQAIQRIGVLEQQPPGARGFVDETRQKGGISDKQNMLPDKLMRQADFREWSEEYLEYIEMQNEHLAELLTLARDSDVPVLGMGNDEDTRLRAKALYKSFKRNIVLSDARSIVVNALNKNPFEAWRQLFAKHDPRNDVAAQRMHDLIMKKKHWKCIRLDEIPTKLTQWEALLREHVKRTGEEALNTISKRALFKAMLPDNVREFLDVQTIFKPGLTYDTIKQAVMDLVQRTTNSATPMLVDALSPHPGAGPSPGAGIGVDAPNQEEPVDSLARRPPTNKPGKGDGKGGAGGKNDGKGGDGRQRETRTCHNCGRVGHIVKDCWRPLKAKGQGNGAGKVGSRELGPDGKWYTKTISS